MTLSGDKDTPGAFARKLREVCIELALVARLGDVEPHAEGARSLGQASRLKFELRIVRIEERPDHGCLGNE